MHECVVLELWAHDRDSSLIVGTSWENVLRLKHTFTNVKEKVLTFTIGFLTLGIEVLHNFQTLKLKCTWQIWFKLGEINH